MSVVDVDVDVGDGGVVERVAAGEDDTMQGLLVVVVVVWCFDRGVVVVPCWFPRASVCVGVCAG